MTKIDEGSFKFSEAVTLPFRVDQFQKFPPLGYFKHGFIIYPKDIHSSIVYACESVKCREFDLKVRYADVSSAVFVEDSGDALMLFSNTSDRDSNPFYKVSFIKAKPN